MEKEKSGLYNDYAAYGLGVMYEEGLGVKQDVKEAVRLYEIARSNCSDGVARTARIYLSGAGGIPKDEVKGFELAKANTGWASECSFILAECYEHGWGTKQDLAEAMKWYLYGSKDSMSEERIQRAKALEDSGVKSKPSLPWNKMYGPTAISKVPLNPSFNTELLDACYTKNVSAARIALSKGANPNCADTVEKGGSTPLFYAW